MCKYKNKQLKKVEGEVAAYTRNALLKIGRKHDINMNKNTLDKVIKDYRYSCIEQNLKGADDAINKSISDMSKDAFSVLEDHLETVKNAIDFDDNSVAGEIVKLGYYEYIKESELRCKNQIQEEIVIIQKQAIKQIAHKFKRYVDNDLLSIEQAINEGINNANYIELLSSLCISSHQAATS